MRQTQSLRRTLEDLTAVYYDGERIGVEFTTGTPHAKVSAFEKPRVAVAPNVADVYGVHVGGPDELRIIVDTLNHEVEHIRSSDLNGKRAFAALYPEAPNTAGTVINIVEDLRIDAIRHARRPGLRTASAFAMDKLMANNHRRPPLDSVKFDRTHPGARYVEGLVQVAFAGYAKNIDNAPDDVRAFLEWVRPLLAFARERDTTEVEANDISHTIMQKLLSVVDDPAELEGYVADADIPVDIDGSEIRPGDAHPDGAEKRPDMIDEDGGASGPDADDAVSDLIDALEDLFDTEDRERPDVGPALADDESMTDADADPDDDDDDDDAPKEADLDEKPDPEKSLGGGMDEDPLSQFDLPDMEEMDGNRSSAEWTGVSPNVDYATATVEDVDRYLRLQRRIAEEKTEIAERIGDRDDRIEKNEQAGDIAMWNASDSIQREMENSGLARDIEHEFAQIKSRDAPVASERGETMNVRNVVRHMAGDADERRFFNRRQPTETGERLVGVVLDMSSSMQEQDAKKALAALAIATEQINDDFAAVAFAKRGRSCISELITAPGEGFEYEHLDSTFASGSTPTAKGIRDMAEILTDSDARQKIIIVVTDGEANKVDTSDFVGDPPSYNATDMARIEIAEAAENGIGTFGLAVGSAASSVNAMTRTFGPNGFVTGDFDSLHESLGQVYKKFLRTTGN